MRKGLDMIQDYRKLLNESRADLTLLHKGRLDPFITLLFRSRGVASEIEEQMLAESICDRLAQRRLLIETADRQHWPDGTETTCFRFIHAFHRQIAYSAIPPIRRRKVHLQIGQRLEEEYAHRINEGDIHARPAFSSRAALCQNGRLR